MWSATADQYDDTQPSRRIAPGSAAWYRLDDRHVASRSLVCPGTRRAGAGAGHRPPGVDLVVVSWYAVISVLRAARSDLLARRPRCSRTTASTQPRRRARHHRQQRADLATRPLMTTPTGSATPPRADVPDSCGLSQAITSGRERRMTYVHTLMEDQVGKLVQILSRARQMLP